MKHNLLLGLCFSATLCGSLSSLAHAEEGQLYPIELSEQSCGIALREAEVFFRVFFDRNITSSACIVGESNAGKTDIAQPLSIVGTASDGSYVVGIASEQADPEHPDVKTSQTFTLYVKKDQLQGKEGDGQQWFRPELSWELKSK